MSSILEIKNLEKTYSGESENLTILKDLNLNLEEGTKCVIIGKSGSGKSTLLNIIGGLDYASSGSVYFDGMEISSMSEDISVSLSFKRFYCSGKYFSSCLYGRAVEKRSNGKSPTAFV